MADKIFFNFPVSYQIVINYQRRCSRPVAVSTPVCDFPQGNPSPVTRKGHAL